MIAVLGATGFTGHRVVRALRDARPDEEIVAVVRSTSDRSRLDGTRATFRVADLADTPALTSALRGAAEVVSVAPLAFGHADFICAAVEAEERRHAVFFSSTSIFTALPTRSRPLLLMAEERVRKNRVPATIVRPTMIYGRPGDRNIERLLRWLSRIPIVPVVGGGTALQQPVHVDDLAAATALVLTCSGATTGQSFNLPGPRPMAFRDLVREGGVAIRRRPLLVPLGARFARGAAGVLSRPPFKVRIRAEQVDRVVEDKACEWAAARLAFGYEPRPFLIGVIEEARLLGLVSSHPASGAVSPPSAPAA